MRKLLLFLLLAVPVFAQNSRYDSVALGPRGPIPNATVAVCTQPANTTTSPCSPLANLCSSLTDATCSSPNPVTADSLGNYHFYGKPTQGPFTIQLYGPQVAAPLAMGDQSIPINAAAASVKSLNNIQFADQWGSVQAAVNALPTSGGTVIVPAGYTETVTSPWIIGGASKVVTLNIDKTAIITFNITGGVDAVQLWSKSSIISEGTNSLTNQLILASTANINNFIANYPRTGGSIFNLRGLTIQGNASATMAGALVDLASVVDNSTISNTVIGQCMNGYGLRIQNTSGGSVGPLNLDNLTVNCNAQTGSKPVLINAAFTNGIISNINFIGGSLVHPGAGGLSIVDIEGGTNNQIQGVSFIGTQFESSNLADIGVNAVNTAGLSMVGTVFTSAVNAGTSCVKLSQSGGITQNINIENLTNFNAWTNTIQDAINTVNITDARISRYVFLPTTPAGFSYVYGSGGLVESIGNTAITFGKPTAVASGTATMTTAAITAGNCGTTVTVAATGVLTTDKITWSFNAAPAGSNAGLVSWPTANNVNFAYCPNSAETPAAATINWGVTR